MTKPQLIALSEHASLTGECLGCGRPLPQPLTACFRCLKIRRGQTRAGVRGDVHDDLRPDTVQFMPDQRYLGGRPPVIRMRREDLEVWDA